MKHLIIYSHLNPKSFTRAVVDEIERVSTTQGNEVRIVDLYGDGFNPILGMPDIEHQFMGKTIPSDVKKYQELVIWADHLTIVYPMWWGQMPAMLKGFVDRVFSHGFAFKVTSLGMEALLKGKTAHIFINANSSTATYQETQMDKAQVRIISEGIFRFCGIETELTLFGEVSSGTQELRERYLETVQKKF